MRCRRRPGRQRCPGRIHVRIGKEDPPEIHWACPRCEENGIIRNWQGSAWDLADVGWDLPEDAHGFEDVHSESRGNSSVIPIYQVDAFTDRLFEGNPAAVCPLTAWLADGLLQKIAAENNLSETAFFVPKDDEFELRWFTPAVEVDLCGHATLAAAFVLMDLLEPARRSPSRPVFPRRSASVPRPFSKPGTPSSSSTTRTWCAASPQTWRSLNRWGVSPSAPRHPALAGTATSITC